jgi:hypothetical protein
MFKSVNWQQIVSLLIVGITAGMFLRAWRRQRVLKLQRHSPCGCGTPRLGDAPPRITFHARKGQRTVVTVCPQ